MNFRQVTYKNSCLSFYFTMCVLMMTCLAAKGFSEDGIVSGVEKSQIAPPAICCEKINSAKTMLELKGGYFFFSSHKMQKIYDHGGYDVQINSSIPLCKWLQIYGSVEYLTRHGRSLNDNQKTSIWEIPLSLGLQPVIAIGSMVQYYFTLGPRYFFVHQHNRSSYVDKTISENGLGGFANMGFHFFPCHHFFIDIFGEYSFKRMSFHPSKSNVYGEKTQIGGFTFGLGLGYSF
jgi:hypothetical protein